MQALLVLLLAGCSLFVEGEKEDVPWDTDIPESEAFDAGYGVWSPDGKQIAFQHTDLDETGEGPFDALWVYDLETKERREIAPGRIVYPAWSPDREWFVFQTATDPQFLWKIRANGEEATPLTGPGSPNPDIGYTVVPAWHPSGDSILFSVSAGDERGLWMIRPDGSNARRIQPYSQHGSWFPDGQRIAYLDWDESLPTERKKQLFVANADSASGQRITDRPTEWLRLPSVSPDGKQVAFVDWSPRGNEVFLMDADGANQRQMTGGRGLIDKVQWSPDGRYILFDRWIPNLSLRLYLLDVQTLEVEPLFPATQKQ